VEASREMSNFFVEDLKAFDSPQLAINPLAKTLRYEKEQRLP
jgi:hypothetical protein